MTDGFISDLRQPLISPLHHRTTTLTQRNKVGNCAYPHDVGNRRQEHVGARDSFRRKCVGQLPTLHSRPGIHNDDTKRPSLGLLCSHQDTLNQGRPVSRQDQHSVYSHSKAQLLTVGLHDTFTAMNSRVVSGWGSIKCGCMLAGSAPQQKAQVWGNQQHTSRM